MVYDLLQNIVGSYEFTSGNSITSISDFIHSNLFYFCANMLALSLDKIYLLYLAIIFVSD